MSVDATPGVLAFRFGGFRLDRRGGGLVRWHDAESAEPVALGSRALDLLTVLVESRGIIAIRTFEADIPGLQISADALQEQPKRHAAPLSYGAPALLSGRK